MALCCSSSYGVPPLVNSAPQMSKGPTPAHLYVCMYIHTYRLIANPSRIMATPRFPRFRFLSQYNNIAMMPYQPKTNAREHSEVTVLIVWNLHKAGFSTPKIKLVTGLPKSTITSIIRRFKNSPNHEYKKTTRTGRARKLNYANTTLATLPPWPAIAAKLFTPGITITTTDTRKQRKNW